VDDKKMMYKEERKAFGRVNILYHSSFGIKGTTSECRFTWKMGK